LVIYGSVEMTMSARFLAIAAMLVLGGPAVQAQGAPFLEGTFTIDIYNGDGGGSEGGNRVQALESNELITGEPLATVTYVGPLDFGLGAGGADTIGAFFASGSGTFSGLDEGTAALTLSSPTFAATTVFDITFAEGAISDGNIVHDDGIGLYVDKELITDPADAAPATEASTDFGSPAGQYRLIYVAANGNPSILRVTGTPVFTPDFVDFSCRIDLAQTDVAPAFQFTLPASSSEKFCPQNNGGTLRLSCSGTIPDYDGPPVSGNDESGVVCRISGSQCGLDDVFTADVSSIEVNDDGFAELTCEAAVGG
jgi:hypothetical protein